MFSKNVFVFDAGFEVKLVERNDVRNDADVADVEICRSDNVDSNSVQKTLAIASASDLTSVLKTLKIKNINPSQLDQDCSPSNMSKNGQFCGTVDSGLTCPVGAHIQSSAVLVEHLIGYNCNEKRSK